MASNPIDQARISQLLTETHTPGAFAELVGEVVKRLVARKGSKDVSMRDLINEFIVMMEGEAEFYRREFQVGF